MVLKKIKKNGIEEFAGVGLFGNSLQADSNITSVILGAVAQRGKLSNLVLGVGITPFLEDSVIQTVTDLLYLAGTKVGETLSREKMHLVEERIDAIYNALGIFKFFFKNISKNSIFE